MKPKTVAEYIAFAPPEIQAKLKEIRKAIKEVAPEAEEKLSYGMPYYGYKGRFAYFAYAKKHVGLYVMPPVVADHKKELEGYETATATVRFPLDEPLPLPLIKKLLKAGKANNDAKK
jgi:uncharacterized protein YdhG (YjbR/CyaY superfamily)